ncbi:MAG: hypothetical protein HY010_10600 [Acidobacteria bacterium]|nr:hypothetical protein [Acidobacteriota bacterium]
MKETVSRKFRSLSAALLLVIATMTLAQVAAAQDDDQYQDDPPDRVARLGYMQGSISIQPAGESEWVGAVSNRPITTGDKIWADQDSRAELSLGSAIIRLAPNTGFSFLNLDDRTSQIQLTAGSIDIRVRQLNRDEIFEIDTPNQAFSIYRPGHYRVDASDDGSYTVISVRDGEGESTGNGRSYTVHAGQRATFSGTDSLNADVEDIGAYDDFDDWARSRDRRYDDSRSARYVSPEVVGYEDLDDYGDWRDDSNYGHVWYPSRVDAGWAPYQTGHWDWISPWGWTWVDDSPWGYAPFHYGRWINFGGRWGWIAGPIAVRPVYAPALVVFIGGGGGGWGSNVGWFPLGPREVYVPSYRVSRGYVNRVNVSNTNVNVTNITNVYNTTIINKTTNITNVTYVNRNIRGAVTAVPQRTFVSAQPVARAQVAVNARDLASASLTSRVAVAPTRESVMGGRATTANRVTAPPERIANRAVVAKVTPPPPPVSFARQQAALAKQPGEPLAKREVQNLRPANTPEARPMVRIAPPGRPATPNVGRAGNQSNQPGTRPQLERPNQQTAPAANRPDGAPAGQTGANPNNPSANRPGNESRPNDARPNDKRPDNPRPNDERNNRPGNNQPADRRPDANGAQPPDRPQGERPNQPANQGNRPDGKRPEITRPEDSTPPVRNDRPSSARPDRRPNANPPNDQRETSRPPADEPKPANADRPNNRPEPPARNDRPSNDRPPDARTNNRPDSNRDQTAPREERPNGGEQRRAAPPENRPDRPPQSRPPTSEEKRQKQEQEKRDRQNNKEEKPPNQ